MGISVDSMHPHKKIAQQSSEAVGTATYSFNQAQHPSCSGAEFRVRVGVKSLNTQELSCSSHRNIPRTVEVLNGILLPH